jgi:hypothetical protein
MEDRLLIKLLQLRRRQALVQAVERGLSWGLWGAWLCLPLLVLLAGLRLGAPEQVSVVWFWPAMALLGFAHGLLTPWSLRKVAHAADQTHGLQERLLTCFGHQQSRKPHTVVSQLLLQETLERLDGIEPTRTFPASWKRPLLRWMVPGLSLLTALVLVPRWLPPPPADPLAQEVLASRQRLDRLSRRLAQHRTAGRKLQQLLQKLPQQVPAQAARQMRQALGELQKQMQKQAAQAAQLGQLAQGTPQQQRQQLEKLRQQLEQQPQAKALLEQAQKALEQGQKEQAQKAIEQAQKELGQGQEMAENEQLGQALQDEMNQLGGAPETGKQGDNPGDGPSGEAQPAKGKGQKGKGRGDFGEGSTNQQGEPGGEAKQKARSQRQNQEERHKEGAFKQLYGSDRKDLQTRRERVALAGGKGKLLRMAEGKLGDPRLGDPSLRRETGDFLAAKALAEQSVAEEKVPVEHRQAVRRYFDNIDPRH